MKYELAKVWISGVVQGVGFRYFIARLATQYGLVGIVKNLYDGRVYIEVEGERDIIQAFLKEVKIGNRWSHVEAIKTEWDEPTGGHDGFEITF